MVKKILGFLGNSLTAILKGEFLIRLGAGRYFGQILYIFLLIGLVIWASLGIDSTLNKVERNNDTIKELEIVATAKRHEYEEHKRRDLTLRELEKFGSELKPQEKPATILKDGTDDE